MKLEQLSHVIEIANSGSFTLAAKNLFMAQPNLSRSIRQLEDELGYSIFVRTSDGVTPTKRGLELIEHARLVHSECQMIMETRQHEVTARRQRLHWACLRSRNTAFLPMIYQKYVNSPISSVCLDCSNMEELLQLVLSLQIDFGFIETISPFVGAVKAKLHNLDIEYHPYNTSKIYAAVGPQNPLFDRQAVRLEELYPHTVISHASLNGDNSTNYSVVLGVENHVRGSIKTNSAKLFNQLIYETSAVGLIATPPNVFYHVCEYKDVRLLEILDSDLTVEMAWIKLRRLPLSDLAQEALEYHFATFR